MPLNALGLAVGIAIARKENVPPDRMARVSLPAAIFPDLALGIILVDRLARGEAGAEAKGPLENIQLTLEDARLISHAIEEGCKASPADQREAKAMLVAYLKELLAELEGEG